MYLLCDSGVLQITCSSIQPQLVLSSYQDQTVTGSAYFEAAGSDVGPFPDASFSCLIQSGGKTVHELPAADCVPATHISFSFTADIPWPANVEYRLKVVADHVTQGTSECLSNTITVNGQVG